MAPVVIKRLAALERRVAKAIELAFALARSASACMICWSRSGASISARSSPALYVRADIGLPILHIAADARIHLRLRISFKPAGQLEGCRLAARIRRRDGDDRHCLFLGPFLELGVGDFARRDAEDDDHHD